MRWLWVGFAVLVTASMLAQSAKQANKPAGEVHVGLVEKGYVCGWCGGAGYGTTITTVRPHDMVEELADAEDPRETPNRKEKQAITKQQGEALGCSIDPRASGISGWNIPSVHRSAGRVGGGGVQRRKQDSG